MLFDKIVFVYLTWEIDEYFRTGSDQLREPALSQLYQRTIVPYGMIDTSVPQVTCVDTPTLAVLTLPHDLQHLDKHRTFARRTHPM